MGEFGVSVFKNFRHLAGTITREVFSLTVSIVLFLAAINVIIEFTLSTQDSFIQEHRLGMKAFMDDLFVYVFFDQRNSTFIKSLHSTWAGMSFRAEKSRCIVIDGGVVRNVTPFTVNLACAKLLLTNLLESSFFLSVK